MTYSPKLFIYGRDACLLKTRQMIFRYAEIATEITEQAAVVEQKMREGEIDLLILCHSLSREAWDIARQAARNSPLPPLLLFLTAGASRYELREAERFYDTWMYPEGLLELVRKLLQNRQTIVAQEEAKNRSNLRQRYQEPASQTALVKSKALASR